MKPAWHTESRRSWQSFDGRCKGPWKAVLSRPFSRAAWVLLLEGLSGYSCQAYGSLKPKTWCRPISLIRVCPFSDELRYPSKCLWPTAYQSAVAGTTAKGLQRYGVAVVQFCKKLWLSRRHIRRNWVLYWGRALWATWASWDTGLIMVPVPGEERPYKRHSCRVYHGRCSGCKGRSAGRCYRVRRLRSVQCCYRLIYAHGLRNAKGSKEDMGVSFVSPHSAAFHYVVDPLHYQKFDFNEWGGAPRSTTYP